jgi:hypothetical protein
MTSEHPWLDWLYVAGILVVGIAIVWAIVKGMLRWAHKPPEKIASPMPTEEMKPAEMPKKPNGPASGTGRKP